MARGQMGGSVSLEGESEYRKALIEITTNLKLMSSEMRLATTEFANGDKTIKETKSTYDNTNKSVKEQKDKVNELREKLVEAEKVYGSNNEKLIDFKIKLNNAENQLIQMEDASDKSNKELKDMKENFDDAGNSGLKFGDIIKANIISDAIKYGISAIADGIKNLASSMNEWASHSSMVKEQEAKLTQVMKNTTGATDEEIQSLIELADAKEKLGVVSTETQLAGLQELGTYVENKESLEALLPVMNDMIAQQYGVGASMESASGIATMMGKVLGNGQVDALSRLGYKFDETQEEILKFGTEEERVKTLTEVITQSVGGMNEALAQTDAGKMELASAYIGELQDTVGEAFQNIKTSIVADFLPSIMEVSSALKGMVSGDIPIEEGMQKITDGLMVGVQKIQEILPSLVDTGMKILSSILEGITSMLPQILPVVMQVITTIITKLTEMLPTLLQAGITILLELVKGIAQALPELIPVAVQCILDLVDTLLDNIDLVIDAALQLIVGLTEGLIEALPILIEKVPTIITKLVNKLTEPEMLDKIVKTAGKLIGELAVGLIKAIPQLIAKVPQIISSLVQGFNNLVSSLGDVGKNLVSGIWEGISGSLQWIKDKITGWVGSVTKFIKKLFGINSPSKLFKDEIGTNLALGIGEGFGDTMKDVSSDMADAIPTEFDTNINANYGTSSTSSYDMYVNAFKEALKDTKVVMNGREMGKFVANTVEEVVYS